jgi:hypothetical protein
VNAVSKQSTLPRSVAPVLCALIAVAGCTAKQEPGAPVAENSFRYDRQIGVAHPKGNEGCIAIANDSIEPGAKVILADQGVENVAFETSRIGEATIVERLSDCDDHHLSTTELSSTGPTYYRIRATDEWNGNGYAFAIVGPSGAVTINKDGNITGDLDGDGMNEFFRICTSNEGAHYQVWSGTPLEGQPRWHWYVYAGYDTEPNCTEKEYFGPK